MKNRFVMRFEGRMTTCAEDELNAFLDTHPNYRISSMTYVNQSAFYYGLLVYFEKIGNDQSYAYDTEVNTKIGKDSELRPQPINMPSKSMVTCPECKTTQPKSNKCWQCGHVL